MFNTDKAQKKWAAVLDHKDAPKFKDNYRRAVTAALLENQQRAILEERSQMQSLNETTGAASIQNFDPILISLVRRAMPNLIAYDIAGVQPMSAPTGLIFALKPKYNSTVNETGVINDITNGQDALHGGKTGATGSTTPTLDAGATATTVTGYGVVPTTVTFTSGVTSITVGANTISNGAFIFGTGVIPGTFVASGGGSTTLVLSQATVGAADTGIYYFAYNAPIDPAFSGNGFDSAGSTLGGGNVAMPYTTSAGEALSGDYDGSTNTTGFKNMGFDIEKTVVSANTRALKANYTMELAQDLKAVHGLDAESELANILSSEILFEINRELIDTINAKAVLGAQFGYTKAGVYDVKTDADGRWAVERYKSMLIALELEANQIAKDTRRGKGNFILCSSNVASALAAAGSLDYAPALKTELEVDDTGNTFAGVLNGRIKVYVDPYAITDYVTVGYRGQNPYDAGIFYAPYVPLTMVRAIDPNTFQPRIAFKTRYGVVANPFVNQINPATTHDVQRGANRSNIYYRTFAVKNLSLRGAQGAVS